VSATGRRGRVDARVDCEVKGRGRKGTSVSVDWVKVHESRWNESPPCILRAYQYDPATASNYSQIDCNRPPKLRCCGSPHRSTGSRWHATIAAQTGDRRELHVRMSTRSTGSHCGAPTAAQTADRRELPLCTYSHPMCSHWHAPTAAQTGDLYEPHWCTSTRSTGSHSRAPTAAQTGDRLAARERGRELVVGVESRDDRVEQIRGEVCQRQRLRARSSGRLKARGGRGCAGPRPDPIDPS
jgi:hypothetical protein